MEKISDKRMILTVIAFANFCLSSICDGKLLSTIFYVIGYIVANILMACALKELLQIFKEDPEKNKEKSELDKMIDDRLDNTLVSFSMFSIFTVVSFVFINDMRMCLCALLTVTVSIIATIINFIVLSIVLRRKKASI